MSGVREQVLDVLVAHGIYAHPGIYEVGDLHTWRCGRDCDCLTRLVDDLARLVEQASQASQASQGSRRQTDEQHQKEDECPGCKEEQ